ncbi:MAG TPA: cytochrome P450 [Acidimicrobiales bacterium]
MQSVCNFAGPAAIEQAPGGIVTTTADGSQRLGDDLYDPDGYVDGPPHEVFARLRRDDPVHRQEMPDGTAYWAVLRHADVVDVARHPVRFSAATGGVMLEDLDPEQLAMMREMLLAMDPPRHAEYRRSLSPYFTARVMAGLEPRIRAVCRSIMVTAAEQSAEDGTLDFVHDVCAPLPAQIIGELVGIPEGDRPKLHHWAERITGFQDDEVSTAREEDALDGSIQMAMYFIELAAQRRAEPREDLLTLTLACDFDGRPMDDMGVGSFFVQLVTAGNDTSRTMLSSGLLALLRHPDQLAELRADPSLIPGAVEEILRWANPLHYFRRTVTEDTELGGTHLAAGDKLAMIYTSANRDEAVFADPHRFDIHRAPNPHLSFGIAEHFCLGVHLARLEARVFFEELLATFPTIELTGDPRRQRSNLNNALKALPVRLAR